MLKKRNQKGFTLIEIIAVLVILGILAAVAIPKFLDLQEEARNKAVEGAFAAGKSQLAMSYARDLLNSANNAGTNTWSLTLTNFSLGDFTADLTGGCGANNSLVNLTGGPGWFNDVTNTSTNTTICD